ncbi:MAG: hypothetical protein Pyrs2KO_25220 [Pyruvatibacter sp.]
MQHNIVEANFKLAIGVGNMSYKRKSQANFGLNVNWLIVSAIAGLTGACTHINEGSVSTRHDVLSKAADMGSAPAAVGAPGVHFFSPQDQQKLSIIEPDTAYSVNILSAYICNFHEFGWTDITLSARGSKACDNKSGDGGGSSATRGEIALVANVVERNSSEANTRNISAKGPGRVVFYSEDIRESGQMLNALNIPIHGPIKYKGAPLHVELAILELDNEENADTQMMLKSLAALGSAAYPPSSAALSILSTLGGALLAGDQDDVEFRHRLEFDRPQVPATGGIPISRTHRMPLAEGYYAFMRSENRSEDPKYDDWTVCRSIGAIVVASSFCPEDDFFASNTVLNDPTANTGIKYYRESTWILVRVSKEDAIAAEEIEVGELLANFTKRNAEAAATNRQNIELELLKASKAITDERVKKKEREKKEREEAAAAAAAANGN